MDYASNVKMCYKCILLGAIVLFLCAEVEVVAAATAPSSSPSPLPSASLPTTHSATPSASQGQQIPLVRLPSNTLLKYTAYKDVSILHFRIPSDTRTALFSFKAYEEPKSAFRKYYIMCILLLLCVVCTRKMHVLM